MEATKMNKAPELRHNHEERRRLSFDAISRQQTDGSKSIKIEGYALLFDDVTDIGGWFQERFAQGCLDDADMTDVRALFNHDPNLPLARTPETLTLEIDEKGLRYSFDIPNTTVGTDLAEMVATKVVSQSSLAFVVKKDSWEYKDDGSELRTIEKIDVLYDVSPVTFPAYANTEVALRSKQIAKRNEKQNPVGFDANVVEDIALHNKLLTAAANSNS